MPEYTCIQCNNVFPKLKQIKKHFIEQKCVYPYACNECSVPFFTRNAAIVHNANTKHATGYDSQQVPSINVVLKDQSAHLTQLFQKTSAGSEPESDLVTTVHSASTPNQNNHTFVIDGRNLYYKCEGFGGLHLFLEQLIKFVSKIPGRNQIIAVVPSFWYFKRGTTMPKALKNLLGNQIRTVQMQIHQNDKEMDDIVAFSLAQAFNGYLISGDKHIPDQVGFDNKSWNEEKLLGVKSTFDRGFDLRLPNRVDLEFERYYDLGWASCTRIEYIQPWHWDEYLAFLNKPGDDQRAFFCPHCSSDFLSFSDLTIHFAQTKHGVMVCKCGDEFHSFAELLAHFSSTKHLSAEGRIFSMRNCIRTMIDIAEEE